MKDTILMSRSIDIYILDLDMHTENYILPLAFLTQFLPHWFILKMSPGMRI